MTISCLLFKSQDLGSAVSTLPSTGRLKVMPCRFLSVSSSVRIEKWEKSKTEDQVNKNSSSLNKGNRDRDGVWISDCN